MVYTDVVPFASLSTNDTISVSTITSRFPFIIYYIDNKWYCECYFLTKMLFKDRNGILVQNIQKIDPKVFQQIILVRYLHNLSIRKMIM